MKGWCCRGGLGMAVIAMVVLAPLSGCNQPKPRPTAVAPVVRDIPEPLRGTIGAEANILGVEPQLVSGFGLVVGLNGTGGGELPPAIHATMVRELSRGGVGRGGMLDVGPMANRSPQEVLRDRNVAVVIVEAAVSPGSPPGSSFDVYVSSIPGTSVTSLEGGTLWTTELRLGPATSFGGYKTRKIGEARGPIFLNPFAGTGSEEADATNLTAGRILNGGSVTDPLQLLLILDNASHTRAAAMVSAINYRFPRGPADEGPTARGRDAESIAIRIPAAYRDNIGDFLELVRCLRIDSAFPQEFAKRYVEDLKLNPWLAYDLGWCLEAIGKPAIPFLAPMYDYPEFAPRMAALRAGARLGDMRAVPHLVDMARHAPASIRTDAIELLGRMPTNPQINLALRELVNDADLDVRVSAYEALAMRNDPMVSRFAVGPDDRPPLFYIESIPAKEPLVYVSQEREPKIVLFGGTEDGLGVRLQRPSLVMAWADRLMLAADGESDPVRIFYRDPRTNRANSYTAPDNLVRLVQFLGQKSTPENPSPGLGLSYSEVVGALYEMQRQGALDIGFATGFDRLQAQVLKASQVTSVTDRPETNDEPAEGPVLVYRPDPSRMQPQPPVPDPGPGRRGSMVVPLNPNRQPPPREE